MIETFDEMFRPAIAQLNQFVPKDNVMQRIENEGSIYPAKIFNFLILIILELLFREKAELPKRQSICRLNPYYSGITFSRVLKLKAMAKLKKS